jgi:hypothetical protein
MLVFIEKMLVYDNKLLEIVNKCRKMFAYVNEMLDNT